MNAHPGIGKDGSERLAAALRAYPARAYPASTPTPLPAKPRPGAAGPWAAGATAKAARPQAVKAAAPPAPPPARGARAAAGAGGGARWGLAAARWAVAHKAMALGIAAMVALAAVVAAVLSIRQDAATTPAVRAPDIEFGPGDDIGTGLGDGLLDDLGFAEVSIGDGGARATLTLYSIPGAAAVSLGEVLELENVGSDSWEVTLSISDSIDTDVTALTFKLVEQGGATLDSAWQPVVPGAGDEPSTGPFTMDAGDVIEISVTSFLFANGTSGAQGSFDVEVTIEPA